MTHVYIAGPMTGQPHWNYPAFHLTEELINDGGAYTAINPARNHGGRTDLPRATYLRTALSQVMGADMVVVIGGWDRSKGALLEVHTATECGIPVYGLACFLDPHWADECRIQYEENGTITHGCDGTLEDEPDHCHGTRCVGKCTCDAPGVSFAVPLYSGPHGNYTHHAVGTCDPCDSDNYSKEPPRARLLNDARNLICGDRNAQYGDPYDDFQRTAAALTALGYKSPSGQAMSPSDVALFQIQVKLSRIISTRTKMDSWTDIAGYAACGYEVAEREE